MKFMYAILICLGLISCLKEVLPLERNETLEKISEIENWIAFSDTSRVYHPFYPGYYELTIQFEITDPFLTSGDIGYSVVGRNLKNGKDVNCYLQRIGGKVVFSNTLFLLQNSEKERCFEFIFKVSGGSEEYGRTKICKVL